MESQCKAVSTPDIHASKMSKEKNQNIQVFVRVRPINHIERSKNSLTVVDCPGTREVIVKDRTVNNLTKTFTFDRVFGASSKQVDVYKTVVAPLLEEVLLGYNCTVFAYGQTGTGKTFTMEGERTDNPNLTWENDPLAGVVPRALAQLFDELRLLGSEFTVRVSFIELYNEELFDLLSPSEDSKLRTLRLYEDSARKGSVIVQGLEEVTVHSKNEVYAIMERGSEKRKTAATQMNASSSRSHTVFTVTVHIKESNLEGEELLKIGKLHLVDLAGSENIARSGAVDKRAREAGSINQSLLTLGRVITALVERTPHIPYRESKLTRLLQDSLGGRTKTSIIATVSPASINVEETLSTLDYAHRAKNITNRPEINQKLTKKTMIKAYTEEIERLRRDLVATREKNGVYVDKDNYDQMVAQIESQGQELSEKIGHSRLLEEKLEAKDVEISNVNAMLEETKEDLAAANGAIQELQADLTLTRNQLSEVLEQRDEKEALVKAHAATEQELSSQASRLLQTANETTDTIVKLYMKLDRKKTVETMNCEAGKRLKEDLNERFGKLGEDLEGFRLDHGEFCGLLRMRSDEFLVQKQVILDNLKKEINLILETCSKATKAGYDTNTKQTTSAFNFVKSLKKNLIFFTEDNKSKLQQNCNYQVDCLDEMQEVQKIIEDKMEEINTKYEETMKQQAEAINAHLAGQYESINSYLLGVQRFSEYMSNFFEDTEQVLSRQRSVVGDFKICMENKIKNVVEELNAVVRETQNFNELYEKSNQDLVNNNKNKKEFVGNHVKVMKEGLEGINAASMAARYSTEHFTANTLSVINHEMEEARDSHYKLYEKTKNSKNCMLAATPLLRDGWDQVLDFTKDKLTQYDNEVKTIADQSNGKLAQFESYRDTQEGTLTEAVSQVDSAVDGIVNETKNELQTHCIGVSMWLDEYQGSLNQLSGQHNEFWDSTYLRDLPTGMTPQRKAYEYPNQLSRTSPYERILGRFRASRMPPVAMTQDLESVPEGSVQSSAPSVCSVDGAGDAESWAEMSKENSPPAQLPEPERKNSTESVKDNEPQASSSKPPVANQEQPKRNDPFSASSSRGYRGRGRARPMNRVLKHSN